MTEETDELACADEDGAMIRTDTRGRARYDAAFRQRVVEAYGSSGMTAMAFARHCGVKYPTLSAWVRKARRGNGEGAAKQAHCEPRFVVAELGTAVGAGVGQERSGVLELEVANGMVVRASDGGGVALLAELVRQLGREGGAS